MRLGWKPIVATGILLSVAGTFRTALKEAHNRPQQTEPTLIYHQVKHAADGKLAADLTIKKGSGFSTTMQFPRASKLGVTKTWACWVFPEDTWAIGGNSEIELYVDDVKLTHFAVAQGEWTVLVQSLAEHITSRVDDPTKQYKITLKNVGDHDVFIRELWIRWLLIQAVTSGGTRQEEAQLDRSPTDLRRISFRLIRTIGDEGPDACPGEGQTNDTGQCVGPAYVFSRSPVHLLVAK